MKYQVLVLMIDTKMKSKANCHPDRDLYGKTLCGSCYQTKWIKDHPEHRKNHLLYQLNATYKKRYGITLQERNELEKTQDFKCAICKEHRRLCVDHDHKTGKLRALICDRCNTLCAYLEADPLLLASARTYLGKHYVG